MADESVSLTPNQAQNIPAITSTDDTIPTESKHEVDTITITDEINVDKEIVLNTENEINIEHKEDEIQPENKEDTSAPQITEEKYTDNKTAITDKEKEDKQHNESLHALSYDVAASLMKVLDDHPVSDDTDLDEHENNESSEYSLSIPYDDDDDEEDDFKEIDEVFDLMDSQGLAEMAFTVRDELKNMHQENKKLWRLKKHRSLGTRSRRNIFLGIQRKQSRDPFHNALAATVLNQETYNKEEKEHSDNDDDNGYMKKMETQLMDLAPKMPEKHILSLNTVDFEDIDEADATIIPLNDTKSATIRAIDTITQKSKNQLSDIPEHNEVDGDEYDEFSVYRRIWYIIRCIVVIYLYIATSFQFAFIYNRDYTDYIVLLLLNWICDVFMWLNILYEYLYYRDDVMDSSTQKVIDDINESETQLAAMNKATKSYRRDKQRKSLETTLREAAEELKDDDNNNDDDQDNRWLNKCISKYFDEHKSESFKIYRFNHKIRFDFMVNFPFDIIILIIWSDSNYFIIARLLKLLHSKRFFEYFNSAFCDWIPERGVMRSAFISRLARLIVTGIAWLHLWSCIWFFLGSNLYIDNGDYTSHTNHEYDTWLTAYYAQLEDINNGESINTKNEYLWSIYFVTVTFSTVGYGDIVPMNCFEIVLLIIFQSINFIFVTIFVAELAPVIEEFGFRLLSRGTQHRMLRNCFESIHIDIKEQDKLLEANRYRWRHQYGMEEHEILAELPRSLSMEMKYTFLERSLLSFVKHIIHKSLEAIEENKEKYLKLSALKPEQLIPAGLVRKIANECIPKTYIRDQVILSQNVENHLLYLLIDGKVKKTYEEDEDDIHMIENYPNFFAHESFWKTTSKSNYTYTAQTVVCVFVISCKQIKDILAPYPMKYDLFAKIFKMAYPTSQKQNDLDSIDTLRRKPALQIVPENQYNTHLYTLYKYTSLAWDIMNAFVIMFQAYSFIWAIAFFSSDFFDKTPYKGPLITNWAIDALFFVDLLLSLYPRIKIVYFYPSRPGGEHRIRRTKDNIILDIITLIPFELMLLIGEWKTVYIYIFRIFKFLRFRYIALSWSSWVELLRSVHIPSKFSKIIFLFFTMIHLLACIWYLIGSLSLRNDDTLNWIVNDEAIQEDDDTISITRSLIRSYYFVLITETTIGYGGVVPFSMFEQLYDVFLVVIGSVLYWISISFFAMHASYQQFTRIEHTNLVTATEFLLQKQHPNYVQQNRLQTTTNDAQKKQKEKDQEQNDELMVRLQNYFDFVLHQREGAVSFWDEQDASLQTLLRYQLLTTAFYTKKVVDPEKYRFLEWIPDEAMLKFAQHLEWIVVCKGQSIKIKQSGPNSLVLFLVTGTLWSPYSKYVYTRHTKHAKRESELNRSDIVTFNLECLSPINMKIAVNKNKQTDVNMMQKLSIYVQIDVDPNNFKDLYEMINGLYEITNAKSLQFDPKVDYQIIYQQIPPDQQQRDLEAQYELMRFDDSDEKKDIENRTLILLIYQIPPDEELETINEDQRQSLNLDDIKTVGEWTFISIKTSDGIPDETTKRVIASYRLIGTEPSIDPKDIHHNGWKINDAALAPDTSMKAVISITDELHFEALECCDMVRLYQRDVLDSFQKYYGLRFQQYLAKTKKMEVRRGSILSPSSRARKGKAAQSGDHLANLIINDNKFAKNKSKKNIQKLKTIRSSQKLLPQFNPSNTAKKKGDDLLRQENMINKTATITQHLQAKDVLKRYHTARFKEEDNKKNKAWLEQVEAIVTDDKYRVFKIIWFLIGILLIVSLQFILPMRAIFENEERFNFFWLDIIAQIYFIFDLFVEWQIFKKREKQRQSQQSFKSVFVIDFILAIPWTFMGLIWSWKVYYFFRLIELLRIRRITTYWNALRHELVHYTGKIISIHAGLSAIIFHIFTLFLIVSYCACLWYIIGITQTQCHGEVLTKRSWICQETKPVYYSDSDSSSSNNYYYLSIYWAMASMSSVGYGDLKPFSMTETVFALIALPFMVGFYIRFMGDMASFAGNVEKSTKTVFWKKFSHTLLALNRRIEYLELYSIQESKQLIDLKKTIRKYLLSLWKERSGMSEHEIYENLPYFLTRDIAYQCRKKYLHSIPCLTKLIESEKVSDIELCKTIAIRLQHHIVTRKDELPLDEIIVCEKGDIRLIKNVKHDHIGLQNVITEKKIDTAASAEEQKEHGTQNSIISAIFNKMNSTTFRKTESARFDVYLPPNPDNEIEYKLRCYSSYGSLYSLPYQLLLEIQMGNDDENRFEVIDTILNDYFYDKKKCNVSNVIQTQDDGDDIKLQDRVSYKSASSKRTMKLTTDEDIVIQHVDYYYLLYNPSRKILRRSHWFRLHWDLLCSFCLFLYALILPLQITNVFHTNSSMISALIVSSIIDCIFVFDFVFRFVFFAPHPIKKLDPFYVMIGTYIDEDHNDKLKRKYVNKLGGTISDPSLIFSDLPHDIFNVRPLFEFVLELAALIPLNLLGLIPSLYSIFNMNIYFRLNKLIYIFLLITAANEAINKFISFKKISFLSARIFRIGILTIIVLHWMSCIWLQLAEFEENETATWLNSMDKKRLNISSWYSAPGYAYLLSLYFVAVTMTTTGYGDITPVTPKEITMTNILIILGDILMALMAGIFIEYISNINQPSLDIAIKERSITHYLHHRRDQIIKRSEEIVADNNNNNEFAINETSLKRHKKLFKKLIKKVSRYFEMQLDYQHKVSTLNSLTQHLPLYYRMKLLHTLFETLFNQYPFLYKNKNLYFRLLDNVEEQIYTYWDDDEFDFIVDPQQTKILDFMIVQFGECHIYSRKDWADIIKRKKSKKNTKYKLKKKGDLIGFRSLILKNKFKHVITPAPINHNNKFKIVSILRIPQNKWLQIVNQVFVNDEDRFKFEKDVKSLIKPDIL